MNGAIIVNRKYGNAKTIIDNKISRLVEEFNKLNSHIDIIINDGHLFYIENGHIVVNIGPYDFIIYLDKDIYTIEALKKSGYYVFTNPEFLRLCDDKLLTHIKVSDLNIQSADVIACPLSFFNAPSSEDEIFVKKVIDKLHLPVVFKLVYGSLGEGVNLINSYEEALSIYRKYKTSPSFFQQYIESGCSSIRVLVLDKKIITCIKRKNDIDFRSNNQNGKGSSLLYEPRKELVEDINKLIDAFDIEYAGIDFIIDKNNKHYFLEMNSNAFFFEAERVSGLNIASLFAKYILSSARK